MHFTSIPRGSVTLQVVQNRVGKSRFQSRGYRHVEVIGVESTIAQESEYPQRKRSSESFSCKREERKPGERLACIEQSKSEQLSTLFVTSPPGRQPLPGRERRRQG